jgi:hypothetical protein
MPPSRSSFRKDRHDRGGAPTPTPPREATLPHCAGVVHGAGGGSLPSDAWRVVSRRGDLRRGDRRRSAGSIRHDSSHLSSGLFRRKARQATQSDERASPWRVIGALGGRSLRRPGPIVIPQGSARP